MTFERTADRMRRILVLVPWVMSRGAPTVEETCSHFGITETELAADIELLMLCGLPPFTPADYIEAEIGGGYVTIRTPAALERPPRLTAAEVLGLLVAGRATEQVLGEEAGALRAALAKLALALSAAEAPLVEDLATRIAVRLDAPGAEMLPALREAIDERARLRIGYYAASRAALGEREIDPLLLVADRNRWYLVARDVSADAERTYRVDRIRDVARTGASFQPPAWFAPERYRDGIAVEAGGEVVVTLEIGRDAAWLAETLPLERAERLDDDTTRLTLRTTGIAWLVPVLLSAGAGARVLAPDELATAVVAEADAALGAYG
ncbi:MAG TPA: WYL domain-containing protein [Actinomycetota bacterium]